MNGALAPEVLLPSHWNPQRLYARFQPELRLEKIQSGLHGDMQRVAEMSTPLRKEASLSRLKPNVGWLWAARLEVVPFPIRLSEIVLVQAKG